MFSKKFIRLFSLALLSLLTSCQAPSLSITVTPTSPSSSSLPTTTKPTSPSSTSPNTSTSITPEVSKEKEVIDFLLNLPKEKNYKQDFYIGEKKHTAIRNENYYLTGIGGNGYALLSTLLPNLEKVVYSIHVDDKVTLYAPYAGSSSSGETSYVTEIDSFDYIVDFSTLEGELDPILFEDRGETLFTDDTGLLSIFAATLHVPTYVQQGYVTGANIAFDGSTLTYSLIQPSNVDETYKFKGKEGEGAIYDVGATTNEVLDSYVSSFNISSSGLPTNAISTLKGPQLVSQSEFDTVFDDGREEAPFGTSVVKYDEDQYEVVLNEGETQTQRYFRKNSDGYVSNEAIDGSNTIVPIPTSDYWDDYFHFPSDQGVLQEDFIRKVDDTTYHYFGADITDLYSALVSTSLGSSVYFPSADFIVEKDRVTKVKFYSNIQLSTDGATYRYLITSSLSYDAPTFDSLKPYEETDESLLLDSYFAPFEDESASYKTITENFDYQGSNYEVLVTPTDYAQTSKILSGLDEVTYEPIYTSSITGYFKNKDGKWQPYTASNESGDWAIKLTGVPLTTTIRELAHFTASGKAFTQNQEGAIVPKNGVYNPSQSLVLGYTGEGVDETTLQLFSDGTQLSSASYSYAAGHDSTGSATITYVLGSAENPVALDANLKAKLNQEQPFQEPTSWKEDTTVYNTLKKYFTDEQIDSFPYIYSTEEHNNWVVDDREDYVEMHTWIEKDPNYLTKLRSLFDERGYTRSKVGDLDYEYTKGNIKIKVHESTNVGFYFYKIK